MTALPYTQLRPRSRWRRFPYMQPTKAYGAKSKDSPIDALSIERREPTATDVQMEILFCGICHSDLHTARSEWGEANYPCVPGHEIVGRVTGVGDGVKNFRTGDIAAVGCLVDSCHTCDNCQEGLEQFCSNGATFTYNSKDKHTGGHTFGGYSKSIVVDEQFVLRVPEGLDHAATAPLLCAGITTYSPLKRWNVGKGQKVGIVGLGGLGHMGLKFAAAFGAEVVLFTTSPGKEADARRLGAHDVIVSKDAAAMEKHTKSFDFILDTVSATHDINAYMQMLKRDGTLVLVGVPPNPMPLQAFSLIAPRRQLAGSLIGGIPETQEMLDFCGKHGITSDIEMISIDRINEAYERMVKSDVKYRFVIDMATL
jgi:alcohol dehydrogenase (NADP+)